jgi:phosphatidylinositol-4-phosphate 3-kinase
MNQLWVRAGLNLHMQTYRITPTSPSSGFIEMREAFTLREIHTKYGVTGSFNNRVLNEWLQYANPLPEDFAQARANFTASCAGYCVVTYILGELRRQTTKERRKRKKENERRKEGRKGK